MIGILILKAPSDREPGMSGKNHVHWVGTGTISYNPLLYLLNIMLRKALSKLPTSRALLSVSKRSFQTSSSVNRVVATNPVKAEELSVCCIL